MCVVRAGRSLVGVRPPSCPPPCSRPLNRHPPYEHLSDHHRPSYRPRHRHLPHQRGFLHPVLFVLWLLASSPSTASVLINEVLYDPDGPDTGLEFVELLNCGSSAVLLTGWTLETGNGASPDDWTVEWIGGDFDRLEAGGILLIGESDVLPVPDVVEPLDLQNGPDGLRLTDGVDVVDVVGWGLPLPPEYYEGEPADDTSLGLSLARVPDCFDEGVNASDFAASEPTPGRRNVEGTDVAVSVVHQVGEVLPLGDVTLDCAVANVGALPVVGGAVAVRLFLDAAALPAATLSINEPLAVRDTVRLSLAFDPGSAGYHTAVIEASLPADADTTDNRARTSFTVGSPGCQVVVNEVMHSPGEHETEWLELVCTSGAPVQIDRWLIGDDEDLSAIDCTGSGSVSSGRTAGRGDRFQLAPGEFIVVARDPEVVEPRTSAPVVALSSWEALSVDDVVVLADEHGTPVDIVRYERSWGGDRDVTLERVRPSLPSGDQANWGSSVSPEGSTPGRVNSIHVSALPVAGRLTISPNPFTPDGDGIDDRCAIRFDLPTPQSTVRLTVFDVLGRVRAVLRDHDLVASSTELIWDGGGEDGAILPAGIYVACLEAIDARAGILVTAKTAVGLVR